MLSERRQLPVLFLILVALFTLPRGSGFARGQANGRSLLDRRVTYIPEDRTPLEELISIGKQFHIPMGIEWVDDEDDAVTAGSSGISGTESGVRLRDVIRSVMKQEQGYRFRMTNGLLSIYRPAVAADPRNFLNIRIREFDVRDANVFAAEKLLQFKIQEATHPEQKYGGWGGGYGHAPGSLLAVENITFSGRNMTVREILNAITAENGNSIWVVHLAPSRTKPGDRYLSQDPWPAPGLHWLTIPMGGPGASASVQPRGQN